MILLLFPGFLEYVIKFGQVLVTYVKNLFEAYALCSYN